MSSSDSDSDQILTNSSSSATWSSCGKSGKRGGTWPLACPASKRPKIDHNSSNIEFIEKFLECSVCLDFPSSPIHSCDNAHFLCGQCAPKFNACPTCQLPKISPNPACDKLANEANKKIQCTNFVAGCKDGVLSTQFVQHLPLCYFRDITCDYNGNCGVKVKFHEYTKHLEDLHKEEIQNGPIFPGYYLYNEKRLRITLNWFPWGPTIIKHDELEFILHAQVSKQSDLFFSWVSILGDKDTAAKYFCKVKFKDRNSPNEFGCTWRLPVLPFHEIPSNESEEKLFEYSGVSTVSVVPMGAIRKLREVDQDGYLRIDVTYEIKDA